MTVITPMTDVPQPRLRHCKGVPHPVLEGGLSATDHEAVFRLAAKGWKSSRIAREIRKHPSTVRWFMYSNGLTVPRYGRQPTVRNCRRRPFSPEEDSFIEQLRGAGVGFAAIASLASERYGHPRSPHTIRCRLVMLAARDDDRGAA